MCINAETSLGTFSVAACTAIFITVRYRTIQAFYAAFVLMLIGAMQLIEYFLWLDQRCGTMNRRASFAIIFLLTCQPIFLLLATAMCVYYEQRRFNLWEGVLICGFVALNVVVAIRWFRKTRALAKTHPTLLCSHRDTESCRLQWSPLRILFENMSGWFTALAWIAYFGAFLMVAYLLHSGATTTQSRRTWKTTFSTIAVLAVSLLYAFVYKRRKFYNIFGSVWCFLGILGSAFSVLYFQATHQ